MPIAAVIEFEQLFHDIDEKKTIQNIYNKYTARKGGARDRSLSKEVLGISAIHSEEDELTGKL